MKNKEGKFVKASPETVSLAGEGAVKELDGQILAANIWNQPGDKSYPISSFTYIMVYKDLSNVKTREQATALLDFLWWTTHDGQNFATELDYAPLSAGVRAKVEKALGVITYKGEAIKVAAK